MTESELVVKRDALKLQIAEIKAIADGVDFKKDGRKRFANCKKEIIKLQMEIESISREIKVLRREQASSETGGFNANFVAIAKSILEEDLYSEIRDLAKGVSK